MRLTFPQGLAIKLGTTPRCMPILFARNLKRMALSAILRALVYANAVSNTPGPVSVSMQKSASSSSLIERLTMSFNIYAKCSTNIEDIVEVVVV